MQLHCKKKRPLIILYPLTCFTQPQVADSISFFVTSSEPLFVNSNIYFVCLSLVAVIVALFSSDDNMGIWAKHDKKYYNHGSWQETKKRSNTNDVTAVICNGHAHAFVPILDALTVKTFLALNIVQCVFNEDCW